MSQSLTDEALRFLAKRMLFQTDIIILQSLLHSDTIDANVSISLLEDLCDSSTVNCENRFCKFLELVFRKKESDVTAVAMVIGMGCHGDGLPWRWVAMEMGCHGDGLPWRCWNFFLLRSILGVSV